MPQDQPIRERYAASRIPNLVFWMPFTYLYKVRLGTVPKLLSWVLIYLMPTAFYSASACPSAPARFALNYLLILLGVFSIYEAGYIHNDTFATRRETQPALRLYPRNLHYFYRHWRPVFLCRLLCTLVCIALLFLLNGNNAAVWRTAVSILLIAPIFLFYNSIRSRHNVFLYPFLVFSRYLPFLLLYPVSAMQVVLLFLSFPCLNMLERFSMPKHRFPLMRRLIPTEQSKTAFRVIYYLLLLALLVPAAIFAHVPLFMLLPICLLGLYRLALWLLLKFKTPKNYLQG